MATFSGVWIDDTKLQDEGIRVKLSSSEPLLTGSRHNTVSIPQRAGAYYYGGQLEPKPFTLDCVFTRSNYADLKARITKFKRLLIDGNGRPKVVQLRFEDEPDRYYNVVYEGLIDIERIADLGVFSVQLIAYDPVAYSVAMSDEISWGSTTAVFLSDYSMGHTGSFSKRFTSGGTTTVVVTGDNVKPIINVTGSGTNVTIKFNARVLTLGTFTNSTWVIDLAEYTILKNGANALGDVSGPWMSMELVRGTNTVTVGGTDLNIDVAFEFRDKWHG
jgi:predicted phage tail component-like protein